MAREIKFRVWDNIDYMSNHFTLHDINLGKIQFTSDCKVMQYTGLKDKNGKEIYEGDICKYDDNDSMSLWVRGELFVVIGLKGRFTARMKPFDKYNGSNQNTMNEDVEDCVTIIGNIYENKN